MTRRLRVTALALLPGAIWAQTPDPSLTFEVATVKAAPPPNMGDGKRMIRVGAQGGPGTNDPGQISYSFVSMRNLLMQAFNLRGYQIQGPSWLDSERFDIVAKVAAGATKDDVRVMLQNLLKERFQLASHNDRKEQSIYALVAGKNGPKMKVSQDQSDPAAAPPAPVVGQAAGTDAPPPPLPDPSRLKFGKDGMPELPPGMRRPGIMMMMTMSPAGMRVKMNGERQTMAQLADSLSNQLDRPVVDMSALTQRYDFILDFAPDPNMMANKMGPLMGPMPGPMPGGMPPPGGAGLAGPGGDAPVHAPETDAATIFVAIQDQLGLKLEPKKAPADLLVVDHLEKTPSEN